MADMDEITTLHYMYRDASNYKKHAAYEVAGYSEELVARLRATLDEGEYFLPELVGLTNPRDLWDSHYEDDHVWNEIEDITCGRCRYVPELYEPADLTERTLDDLVLAFERAAAAGWPLDAALADLDEFTASTPEGH